MSGTLGSGMDILIEISSDFIGQIIRKIFNDIRICIEDDTVTVTDDQGNPIQIQVRNVVPYIHDLQLGQNNGVTINLSLRAKYGEFFNAAQAAWLDIPDQFTIQYSLGLGVSESGADLTIDTSDLPHQIQNRLGQIPNIPIPLDLLTQRVTAPDGVPGVDLWTAGVSEILLKVVESNLLIGVDVELSQDEEFLRDHGFASVLELGRDLPGGTPRVCFLPEQPTADRAAFDDFTSSFIDHDDWAVALDEHIVDALLRGKPSFGLNNPGSPHDCGPEGALRFICLHLSELVESDLTAGIVRVRGEGNVFVCPEEWFLFIDFAPDDWYGIDFRADVTLSVLPSGLQGEYVLTSASVGGQDALETIEENFPDLFAGEISVGVSNTFGNAEDTLGQLRMTDVEVFTDGLVLRGIRTSVLLNPAIDAPSRVLFATACEEDDEPNDEPHEATFTIAGRNALLHVCPLVIRGTDAVSFSVVSPAALQPGGDGVTIEPGNSETVRVSLTGQRGRNYSANLDIPNNAERWTVELIGDLRIPDVLREPEELQLTRTDHVGLCTGELPPAGLIRRGVKLTNLGPGNLRICSVEISDNDTNPDGREVFHLPEQPLDRILAVDEQIRIGVNFRPGESGVGQEFNGMLGIVTNAGSVSVELTGRLDRSTDWDSDGLAGSFVSNFDDPSGFFCGKADWDMIRGLGGRILDPRQAEEFFSFLGGVDCCPPPRGPACLCVDLWEIAFGDLPRNVSLEVLNQSGQVIAADRSRVHGRTLMVPIKEGNGYTLQAKISPSMTGARSSPVIMRRWLIQQDSLYTTSQPLSDLSVAGEYAYAVGPSSMEVISLTNLEQPSRVAQVHRLAGATSVRVFGGYLLVTNEALKIYSLAEPKEPRLVSKLALGSGTKIFLAAQTQGPASFVYAIGQGLHILDLSDPEQPHQVATFDTRLQTNQALQQGNYMYLFGKEGMEVCDLSKPDRPAILGFLPSQQEIRNALLVGSCALLIYDSKTIDMVDVSKPSRPRLAGRWNLENWMGEYVPLNGSLVRHKSHFLTLKGDRLGFRLMHMRRNAVNREKLRQKRGQSV
jgi:hypothetical protein